MSTAILEILVWAFGVAAVPPSTAPESGVSADSPPGLIVPSSSPRVTPEQLHHLIEQLGHPRFEMRESATQQLCALDAEYLAELVRRYRAEPRYEMKRRIRYIIEHIFLRPAIAGKDGFMGIQVLQQVLPGLVDPQTGKPVVGVAIERVLEGHPAERAGLQSNDIIISLDNQALPDDPSSQTFIKSVSSRTPGSIMSLRVLRARVEPRFLDTRAAPDPRRSFEGASLQYVLQGIRVLDAPPGTHAAVMGLRANDVIRSVNGRDLGAPNGPVALERALVATEPAGKLRLGLVDVAAIPVKVTLGSRPLELMQPADWTEAKTRFLRWWQDQGGESPPRASGSLMSRNVFGSGQTIVQMPETSIIP